MKFILAIVLTISAIGIWAYTHPEKVGAAIMSQNEAPAAEILVGVAESLIPMCEEEKMQQKLGMSRAECEQHLVDSEPACIQEVSAQWPEALTTPEQMEEIMTFFNECLMETEV